MGYDSKTRYEATEAVRGGARFARVPIAAPKPVPEQARGRLR